LISEDASGELLMAHSTILAVMAGANRNRGEHDFPNERSVCFR
jgi:hypothetical protein